MTATESHTKGNEEMINLMSEIGLGNDYHWANITPEYGGWRFSKNIDLAKIKPITRALTPNEYMLIEAIYDMRGVRVPMLIAPSPECLRIAKWFQSHSF